jgi:hypothetical protein
VSDTKLDAGVGVQTLGDASLDSRIKDRADMPRSDSTFSLVARRVIAAAREGRQLPRCSEPCRAHGTAEFRGHTWRPVHTADLEEDGHAGSAS